MKQEVSSVIKAEARLQAVRRTRRERCEEKSTDSELWDQRKGLWAGSKGAHLCTGFCPKLAKIGKGQWENGSKIWVEHLAVYLPAEAGGKGRRLLGGKKAFKGACPALTQQTRGQGSYAQF